MIDFLRGQVAHMESDYVVIDTGSVGYRVFCANPYAFSFGGEEVTVYIHYHVREDAHLLYGFESREEQRLFRRLLDVSGIGPRVALGMLAGGRPDALVMAIRREDIVYLSKLPGIGKKTAQRVILDLKDKLADFYADAAPVTGIAPVVTTAASVGSGAWAEAKEGLAALGYKETELDQAWAAISEEAGPDAPVDQWMKLALKALYKG